MSEGVVKRGRGRPRKDSIPQTSDIGNNIKSSVVSEKVNLVNTDNVKREPINSNNIVNEPFTKKSTYSYIKPNFEDDDEDLKQFLRKSKKENKMSNETNIDYTQNDLDEQILLDIENNGTVNQTDDITEDEFNPLEPPVKERGYTGGMSQNTQPNKNNIRNTNEEKIIEEPKYNTGNASAQIEVDSNLFNPNNNSQNTSTSNDIPDDSKSNDSNSSNNNSGNNSNGGSGSSSTKTEQKPVQENDNLKELSPKEKREAIEKTTDSILLAYKNYAPMPFVYFSSHNLKKLQKLHDTDEIDLDTEVRRDGTTFLEYAKDFNNKVEKAFEISDAEIEALREPLFDVLMEQDIAFTPTQRLMFVAGQLVVAKVMMCVKFLREKKNDVDEMKVIHREKMDLLRNQEEQRIINKRPRPEQRSDNVTYTTPPSNIKSDDVEDNNYINNNKINSDTDDEATIAAKKDISKEEVVNYTEIKDTTSNPSITKTPTLDDILNAESNEEEDLDKDSDIDDETIIDNDIPE